MAASFAYLDWPGPIPLAHRGGTGSAPENTLPAFRHAVDIGFVYLETDVQVTSDGVPLAFHDDDLNRTCGIDRRVHDMTWSEVRSVLVDGREPIPRLDDLFEEFPDARLNIDCKSDAAVDALVAAIERHGAAERVCVAAFSDRRLRRLRTRLGPTVVTALGPLQIATLRLTGARLGRGQTAQVPVRQGPVTVVDERFVRRSRARSIAVHVWTIDDRDEMHRLLDLGVDGIMTDRPETLRDVLVERGQWTDP